jgi:hypothetical protein
MEMKKEKTTFDYNNLEVVFPLVVFRYILKSKKTHAYK